MKHQDNDPQPNVLTGSCNQWHLRFTAKATNSFQAAEQQSGSRHRLMWAASREGPPGDEYFQSDDLARGRPPEVTSLLFRAAMCKKPVGELHLMPDDVYSWISYTARNGTRALLCEISPGNRHLPPVNDRSGSHEADGNSFHTETMKKPPGYEFVPPELAKINDLLLRDNITERAEFLEISPGDKFLPPVNDSGGPHEADGNIFQSETMKKPPGYGFVPPELSEINALMLHDNISERAELIEISPGDKHLLPANVRGGTCEDDGNVFQSETMKKPPGYEFVPPELAKINALLLHDNISERAELIEISPGDKFLPPVNDRGGPNEADGNPFQSEAMKKPPGYRFVPPESAEISKLLLCGNTPERAELLEISPGDKHLPPVKVRGGTCEADRKNYQAETLKKPPEVADILHHEAMQIRPDQQNTGVFITQVNQLLMCAGVNSALGSADAIFLRLARDGISGMLQAKYYRMPRNGTDIQPDENDLDASCGSDCGISISVNNDASNHGSVLFRRRNCFRLNRLNSAVMGEECSSENQSKYGFYQQNSEFPFARSTRDDLQSPIVQRFEKLRKSLLSDSKTLIKNADKTGGLNQNQKTVNCPIRHTKTKSVEWYSA